MKTKHLTQVGATVLGLAVLTVLGLSRPAEADERTYPHIHYIATITQADGRPVPFDAPAFGLFIPGDQFAPPGCFDGGSGSGPRTGRPGTWEIWVSVRDTQVCVQAMQTFQPPPTAFPLPAKPGWTFTRK